jgi:hypothetical protein
MPKFTLDLETKIFSAKAGVREVDVGVDLYSDWKEVVLSGDALQYPPALRTVGGDPITPTQDLGATYFLINNYRIRPDEADHELTLTGNLWTDPSTNDLVVSTLGTYTVLVKQRVSNLVDSSVARLDLAQLLPAVYIDAVEGDDANDGTPTSPVQTAAAARVIADDKNLRAYVLRGTITITQDHVGWSFRGDSAEGNDIINLGGYDFDNTKFTSCVLTGALTGVTEATECGLNVVTNLDGVLRRCGLISDFTVAAGANLVMDSCFSEVAGTATPAMSVGANAVISMRNYSGGIELKTFTAGSTASIDLDPGHLIMSNGEGNTGGEVLVRGSGRKTIGNAVGTTIYSEGLLSGVELHEIHQILAGKVVITSDGTQVTVYEENEVTIIAQFSVTPDGLIRTRTT